MYRTERQAIDALIQEHGKPKLRSKSFHAYQNAPKELRMFFAMRLLESEIANGGLAQFLWNVFYHWKLICDDCSFGYSLIGAKAQAAAMPNLIKALSQQEKECEVFIAKAISKPSEDVFSQWYQIGEARLSVPEEELFSDHQNLAEMKKRWLKARR